MAQDLEVFVYNAATAEPELIGSFLHVPVLNVVQSLSSMWCLVRAQQSHTELMLHYPFGVRLPKTFSAWIVWGPVMYTFQPLNRLRF